ncbi:MAG TPA: inositol monophosphatase family protein [Candidatus Saccharimonadales bacterium]|nr:inositol monophosphatase family protein [Candidatus Saccharimonadales bacterium]
MNYSLETKTAIEVVRDASELCQNVRTEWSEAHRSQKADVGNTPVTVADFGAQVLINAGICDRFPDDEVIAEETSTMLRPYLDNEYEGSTLETITEHVGRFRAATPVEVLNWIDVGDSKGGLGRHWSVDPIDGTKGYLLDEQYAVSLGLFENGEVLTGVLGCPNYPHDIANPDGDKGVLFIAERGLGMQAVDLKDPTRHIAPATPPVPRIVQRREIKLNDTTFNRHVAAELGLNQEALNMDSQAKYGAVALGAAQVYLRFKPNKHEHIWDHVPGIIIAQEGGATVTDVYGKRLDLTAGRDLVRNQGILVSKGIDHAAAVAGLQRVLARS